MPCIWNSQKRESHCGITTSLSLFDAPAPGLTNIYVSLTNHAHQIKTQPVSDPTGDLQHSNAPGAEQNIKPHSQRDCFSSRESHLNQKGRKYRNRPHKPISCEKGGKQTEP